jgi:hypothetical protein
MQKGISWRLGLAVVAVVVSSTPLLAKMKLAPQIVQAIKSWQHCTATAYKAQRRGKINKDDAAEASFRSCQAQFDRVIKRAAENGLPPDAVRMALNNAKMNLKIQMSAQD